MTIESLEGDSAPVAPTPPPPPQRTATRRPPLQSVRPTPTRIVPPQASPPPAQTTNTQIYEERSTKSPELPKMIPNKRIVDMSFDDDEEVELMDIDPPLRKPTIPRQQPTPPSPLKEEQQPMISPFVTPQKRVRVGLSKRTSSALHQSTHKEALVAENTTPLTTPQMKQPSRDEAPQPTPRTNNTPSTRQNLEESNSSFTPASKIPTNTNDPGESSSSSTSSNIEPSKPFKSPFAEGK